jgi:hypothetical protein
MSMLLLFTGARTPALAPLDGFGTPANSTTTTLDAVARAPSQQGTSGRPPLLLIRRTARCCAPAHAPLRWPLAARAQMAWTACVSWETTIIPHLPAAVASRA